MSQDPHAPHGSTPSGKIRYNNELLYAGSPMYFYCKHCGEQSDVLPEDYTSKPKNVCADCKKKGLD